MALKLLLLSAAALCLWPAGVRPDERLPSESQCRPYVEKALKSLERAADEPPALRVSEEPYVDRQRRDVGEAPPGAADSGEDASMQGDAPADESGEARPESEEEGEDASIEAADSREEASAEANDDTAERASEEADDRTAEDGSEEAKDDTAEEGSEEAKDDTAEEGSEEAKDDTAEEGSEEAKDDTAEEGSEEVKDETAEDASEEAKDDTAEEGSEEAKDQTVEEGSDEAKDQTAEEDSEEAKDQTAEENSEEAKDQTAEEGSDEAKDQTAEEVSEEAKDETAEEGSEEAKDETAEDASEEAKDETAEEASKEAKDETAEEASEEAKDETAEEASEEAKDETAEEASNEAKDETAEEASEEAKDQTAEEASGEAKDETAEEASEEAKDETAEEASEEAKDETAEEASEEAKDETAEEASKEAKDETEEASEEAKDQTAEDETAEEASGEAKDDTAEEASEEAKDKTAEDETAEDASEEAKGETTEEASAESAQADEAAASDEGDAPSEEEEVSPEEDLLLEIDIPENLRPRDHVAQILRLDEESTESELLIEKSSDAVLRELKRLYDGAIKPLEILYKYRDLSNRHFGDPEIFSKPLVLFMGPWSGGKSSLINYLTDNEFTEWSLRTGAEPSPAYFNILTHGKEPEVLDGTQLAADWTFSGLQKFGQGLEERLRGLRLPSKLLERVNVVEIPGILEVRKQVSRVFPFNDACQWFIDRADVIFLVYDPSKLDVGPETEAILDQLKGREAQTRILLNKADQVKPEELMRVQSALIWNISPLMSSAQPPVMYTTSLWSMPYEAGAPARLLQSQEKAFLRDLRGAIDKRVENKIASARRFAVRVRNHAKMVDCYLTTYYNHKTIFANKKVVAEAIVDHPQNYHIYEGLSTLTNISRYDLPDPETYADFFRLNPLYEFQQLAATCTYFRGCPINRLDVAIAYDLPELVGKYKKLVETATPQGMPKS